MTLTPPTDPPDLPAPRAVSRLALALSAMLVVVGGWVAFFWAPAVHLGVGLWVTEVVVFFGLVRGLLRFGRRDPDRYTGFGFPGVPPLVAGFLAGAINYLVAVVPLQFLATRLAPVAWRSEYDQSKLFEQQTGVELFLIISGVTLAAPICEEFFFRGVLLRGLVRAEDGRGLPKFAAVALTALIFACFHFNPVALLALFELGVLFGALALKSRSVWPGIAAHAANNLVSSTAYLLTAGSTGADEDLSGKGIAALIGIGLPLAAGLIFAMRRFPSLLRAQMPAEDVLIQPPSSLLRQFAIWGGAGLVVMGAAALVDRRTVELNVIDNFKVPLRPLPHDASEDDRMTREGLDAIRAKAQRGELPVTMYEERRRAESSRTPRRQAVARADGFRENEQMAVLHLRVKKGATEESPEVQALSERARKVGESLGDRGEVDAVNLVGEALTVELYGRDADELANAVRSEFSGADGTLELRRGKPGTAVSTEKL